MRLHLVKVLTSSVSNSNIFLSKGSIFRQYILVAPNYTICNNLTRRDVIANVYQQFCGMLASTSSFQRLLAARWKTEDTLPVRNILSTNKYKFYSRS